MSRRRGNGDRMGRRRRAEESTPPIGEARPLGDPEVVEYYFDMLEAIWRGLEPRPRTDAVRPIWGHLCANALAESLARAGLLLKFMPDEKEHRQDIQFALLEFLARYTRDPRFQFPPERPN